MARKTHRRKRAKHRRKVSGNQSFAPAVVSGTRKHKRKRSRKRSHKMGAVTGSETGDMILGLIAGVATGVIIDKVTDKQFPDVDKRIISGVETLGGGALVVAGKGAFAKSFGAGLAGTGLRNAAHDFGIIQGMEQFIQGIGQEKDDVLLIEMNGVDLNSTKMVAGNQEMAPPVVSGSAQRVYGSENNLPPVVSGL